MKEKLLALLVAKFAGVPEATLERIAAKKAGSVTDEGQLQSIVDGIDYGQIVQSDVDSKITEANKKAVQNYEATHKLKDGKPVTDPAPGKEAKTGEDDTPAWAKALIEQNKALSDKIATIEGSKTTESRLQQLEGRLKNVPEAFKAKALKDFKRMQFDNEESFTEYLTEVDTDITALNQELADSKLAGGTKPIFGSKGADGVSSAVAGYIAEKSNQAKPLEGKQL